MVESYNNSDYLLQLFYEIADKDPLLITERAGSKYIRQYWRYRNIKICVTKTKLSHEIMSISLTKL